MRRYPAYSQGIVDTKLADKYRKWIVAGRPAEKEKPDLAGLEPRVRDFILTVLPRQAPLRSKDDLIERLHIFFGKSATRDELRAAVQGLIDKGYLTIGDD